MITTQMVRVRNYVMDSEINIEKLQKLIHYADELGLEMFIDWSGDEYDEEFVGSFISEKKN